MNPFFTEYSEFLSRLFPFGKMQKISVNAGFSCPNRDGTLGTGGCIYCNNNTFTPSYCLKGDSIETQIEKGKKFFSRKYPKMRFIAYFQSYTATYGCINDVVSIFRRALDCEKVDGLIVGTRPDCVNAELIDMLSEINHEKRVIIEYGAESSCDKTLEEINRRHTWDQTVRAVEMTDRAGISCGLHLIAGLPGESPDRVIETVKDAVALPVDTIKLHQLQVIKGTELERRWRENTGYVHIFTVEEYLNLCAEIVNVVPRRIAIERFVSQSPADLLVAPRWGLKNYEFTNLLLKLLKQKVLQ